MADAPAAWSAPRPPTIPRAEAGVAVSKRPGKQLTEHPQNARLARIMLANPTGRVLSGKAESPSISQGAGISQALARTAQAHHRHPGVTSNANDTGALYRCGFR
jgi:hypothetical protein